MSAAVGLEAIIQRTALDGVRHPEPLLAWLEQAFELAARAPRSEERTQGYRLLLRTLSEASTAVLARFPDETKRWFEERIKGGDTKLRICIEGVLEQAPRSGAAGRILHSLGQTIEATARPARDPRTVVGPTRRRGSR